MVLININKEWFDNQKEITLKVPVIYDSKDCAIGEVLTKNYPLIPHTVFMCYYKMNDNTSELLICGDNSLTCGNIKFKFIKE